jgi:hypothetical protein
MITFLKHRSTWLLTIAAFAILVAVLIAQVPRQTSRTLPQERTLVSKQEQQEDKRKRKHRYARKISGIKVVDIRNLQEDDWVEKLEVEIKNISDKPIYYIRVAIIVDEIKPAPNFYPLNFVYRFGNSRHINLGSLAEPEDESIKPGESLVIKIPQDQVEGWNRWKAEQNFPPVTKVQFYFELVNFGDGTGYFGGEPSSHKPKRAALTTPERRDDLARGLRAFYSSEYGDKWRWKAEWVRDAASYLKERILPDFVKANIEPHPAATFLSDCNPHIPGCEWLCCTNRSDEAADAMKW